MRSCLSPVYGLILLLVLSLSCNRDDDPPERVNKLRGVGIRADSPVVSGAAVVGLEIVALLPSERNISLSEAYLDEETPEALRLTMTLNEDGNLSSYGALSLYRQTGTVSVPAPTAAISEAMNGVVRFRYGVRLRADDGKEEVMLGDVLSVAADSEALGWTAHQLTLDSPDEGNGRQAPLALKASLTKSVDEPVKLFWYVSSGTIKSPVAPETEWRDAAPGEQTLLLAIYPKKSRFFQWEIRRITIL
ncbi:MAG: hypothetical protein H6618_04755 [Deltaproteobacteria bacterium]|nr:hypothetical protein [Deltaproteobacteria bacterium]